MSDALTIVSSNKCHGGWYKRYSHVSGVLGCEMTFGIFLPPGASADDPVPVAYWLSGLTCNDENFMQKAGAQRVAAELGIALVAPDTSPRGEAVPDDPTAPMISARGRGSTSTRHRSPGHGTIGCMTMSSRNCRHWWKHPSR